MLTREMIPTLHSVVRERAVKGSIYSLLIWGTINLGFWLFLGADDRRFLSALPRASTDIFLLANGGAIIGASMLLLGTLGMLIRVPAVLLFDGVSLLLVGMWNAAFDFLAMSALQRYGYSVKPGMTVWIMLGASQFIWGLRQLLRYRRVSSWSGAAVPQHEMEQFKRALSARVKQPQDASVGRLQATIHLRGIVAQTEDYVGWIDSDCAIFVSRRLDNCFVIEKSTAQHLTSGKNGTLRLATDAGMKSITFEPQSLAALQRWAGGQGAGLHAEPLADLEGEPPDIFPLRPMADNSALGFVPDVIAASTPEMEERQAKAKRSTGNLGDWLEMGDSGDRHTRVPTSMPLQSLPNEVAPKAAAGGSSKRSHSLARESGGLAEWMKRGKGTQAPPVGDQAPAPRSRPEVPPEEAEPVTDSSRDAGKPAVGKGASRAGANRPAGTRPLPRGTYAHFLLVDIASPVREIRGVPRYLPVREIPTLLGRYEKAHIHLDDPGTVHLKHATLDLQRLHNKSVFVVRPLEDAQVTVNGERVDSAGVALKSEDRIQIGSAKLIFFQTTLNASSTD